MGGPVDKAVRKAAREAKSLEWALKVGQQRRSIAFYRSIRFLIRVFLWRWLRTQHRGSKNIPVTGPVILAPVHRSNLDAPLLSACTERQLRALAKESLFVNPMGAWICAALGSIPLRRGEADRDAMRAARALLDSGAMLLVFPEGTRQTGDQVTGVFDGMSYLASKTQAPIIPVGIAGTESALPPGSKFPRRVRTAIVVGPPIRTPEGRLSRPELAALSVEVGSRLQEAFDQAQALANNQRES